MEIPSNNMVGTANQDPSANVEGPISQEAEAPEEVAPETRDEDQPPRQESQDAKEEPAEDEKPV